MIGTQILQGQGLGNRLFCYVTARSIAGTEKNFIRRTRKGNPVKRSDRKQFRAISGSLDGRRSKNRKILHAFMRKKKNGSTRAPAGMIWSTAAMWREKTGAFSM